MSQGKVMNELTAQLQQLATTTTASSATLPDLPPELRWTIWENIEDPPVSVNIRRAEEVNMWKTIYAEPGQALPTGIHANQEARHVVSKKYKLAFGGINNRPKLFNFERDWLELQSSFLLWLRRRPTYEFIWSPPLVHKRRTLFKDFRKVQNLRYYQDPKGARYAGYLVANAPIWHKVRQFQWFQSLKSLELVYFGNEADLQRQPSVAVQQARIDSLWEEQVNPRRVGEGKKAVPPPTVIVCLCRDRSRFDVDPFADAYDILGA